jgi:hypothetical protein
MQHLVAKPRTYYGIFLISLATLMYEIMLTRIFSLTTWYHFAFLTISLAMLGMTIGSIIVYLGSDIFVKERTASHMAGSALAFGVLSVVSIFVHLLTPWLIPTADPKTVIPVSLVIAVPLLIATFSCSGICISLCLTRYGQQVNKLYATDLAGAAFGCLLIVFTLGYLDGISEIFLIGFFAAAAALFFGQAASEAQKGEVRAGANSAEDDETSVSPGVDSSPALTAERPRRFSKMAALGVAILFAVIAAVNSVSAANQHPILRIFWSKGEIEKSVLFEKWNCFSRIRVYGDPQSSPIRPLSHGMSVTMPEDVKCRVLTLDMDGSANTALYQNTNKPTETDFVLYDLAYLAHSLRHNADVAVIGVGGGRDVLAAVKMGQKSVTGIEFNADILSALTTRYSDWTNNLGHNPIVSLHNDEARSWISRSKTNFDIIQASMIDTFAASSSGAYALTENCLYTTEAWKTFIDHLSPNGILTMSRWYRDPRPIEMYRLTRLASAALKAAGIEDSASHIMVVRNMNSEYARKLNRPDDGFGTILVCKSPFSAAEVQQVKDICAKRKFDLVYAPGFTPNKQFALAAAGESDPSELFDITAPTDDRPFFFQMLRLDRCFDPKVYADDSGLAAALSGSSLLITALATLFISFYCFRLPLLLSKDKPNLKESAPAFGYFVAIGVGFMLIEISQIYRFSIFLGHPVYALTAGLFSFLLSTGVGSYLMQVLSKGEEKAYFRLSAAIIIILSIAGILSTVLMHQVLDSTTMRVLSVASVIFFSGLGLGLAFPMGMKLMLNRNEKIAPWLWGANGAGSVCGSVFGTVISMFAGINFCYWTGVACYVVALLCIKRLLSTKSSSI